MQVLGLDVQGLGEIFADLQSLGTAAMSGLPTLQVDVWSDTACPWCYVGVLRYKKALAKLNAKVASKAQVATKYHSYMIDPATDPKGECLSYSIS